MRPDATPGPTTLRLAPGLRDQLGRLALAAYPAEACGLLVGRRRALERVVVRVVATRNLLRERANDRYEVDPGDYVAAERGARAAGLEVVGVWHSHPDRDARPSDADRRAAWQGWSYLIQSSGAERAGELRSWCLVDGAFREERLRA